MGVKISPLQLCKELYESPESEKTIIIGNHIKLIKIKNDGNECDIVTDKDKDIEDAFNGDISNLYFFSNNLKVISQNPTEKDDFTEFVELFIPNESVLITGEIYRGVNNPERLGIISEMDLQKRKLSYNAYVSENKRNKNIYKLQIEKLNPEEAMIYLLESD